MAESANLAGRCDRPYPMGGTKVRCVLPACIGASL